MSTSTTCLSLLIAIGALVACDTSVDSKNAAIIDMACATDADCPTDFVCVAESDDDGTPSFCQATDDSGTCPAGFEIEVEHGQIYCQPHGGDDDEGSTGDDAQGDACVVDADCAAGLECEHGACAPHGGDESSDDDGASQDECVLDADCTGGLECEHGSCAPHGGGN